MTVRDPPPGQSNVRGSQVKTDRSSPEAVGDRCGRAAADKRIEDNIADS